VESVSVWVILLAAGAGQRLGLDQPKGFASLGGRPMLEWSMRAAAASPHVSAIVVVVPAGLVEEGRRLVDGFPIAASVIEGGDSRQASVHAGLSAVPAAAEVVVCHDAARPLAPPELFDRVLAALSRTGADGVVPVVPSPDTVKRVGRGHVVETIARDEVGLAQTPQAFDAATLRRAHRRALRSGLRGTDDAMLLEALGHRVAVIEGAATNFKITTLEDLERAERILSGRAGMSTGASSG
jgi:2-C-methyl-D-erythritol 4-phosphate cytidylyltransferase